MRAVFVAAVAACALVASASVTELIPCQRFDDCDGTHIGGGWANTDLIRGSYYNFVTEDLWRCDNPGGQELVYPISGKAAIFDSDAVSASDNLPENSALTSPVFDTRGVDFATQAIVIDWDQYFVEGYEAKIFVEVWNGHAWLEVYSETETTFNPDHQVIDITEHVAGARGNGMESRIRFRWTGDASWFWVVDNIRILRVDLAVNPNGCPSNAPHKCAHDGACVVHDGDCLLSNNCPADAPVRCLDGSCVAAGDYACSDLIDCPSSAPVRCASGSCAASALECATASNCPITKPQRCADGSCAASVHDCPLTLACPDEFAPVPCRGGSCAAAAELCPKVKATDLICPCDMVQCPDLTCASSYDECSCPCEYPYLCSESRTCVQESIFCADTSLPKPSVVAERFGGYGAVRMVRVDACPEGHFRCFDGACVASLSQCADVPCSAFESHGTAALTQRCPDGSCAASRDDCAPIPSCGSRWLKRCGDGSCAHIDDECPAVDDCSHGRKRAPDGRCYAQLPKFDGCPVDKPIECPNGRCACNVEQCYSGCGPKQHKCADGECVDWAEDCGTLPSDHRAVPFEANAVCVALREDSMYYDTILVADRHFGDLFASIMIPSGILGHLGDEESIVVADVPLSEVRPLPPFPEAISHVLGVALPAAIFAHDDFVRITMRVEQVVGYTSDDYCLASLNDGAWQCVDNALVQDGNHFSGLVSSMGTQGLFVIMRKPAVCSGYRGFSDDVIEFALLGKTTSKTITRLQTLHQRLTAIRDRMDLIKRSDASLAAISRATYAFTQECLSESWLEQLELLPAQLGFEHPPMIGGSNGGNDAHDMPPHAHGSDMDNHR